MSPTRRSFIKAFIGAGTVAVLPESAFARSNPRLPVIEEGNYAHLIPASLTFCCVLSPGLTESDLRERFREPDVQAGLADVIAWHKIAIQIAEEELR